MNEKIFKAYDIRGVYPGEIDETAAKIIAKAYAQFLIGNQPLAPGTEASQVAVGHDVRLSSPALARAVIEGLLESGVNVIDIGQIPTEMLYFAVGVQKLDGGIQITASHNPAEFNGLKMVKRGVEGINQDTGLQKIQELALSDQDFSAEQPGTVSEKNLEEDYFNFLAQLANFKAIRPVKVVANNNFGLSGPLFKRLLERLDAAQVEIIELNFQPNGSFPKGSPSPQLVENRAEVSELIRQEKADFGVSWDPDGDRCFLADEHGEFIQGCHLTALLAEMLLKDRPGEKVIFDATNTFAPGETIKKVGGVPLVNRVGHAFIKTRMKSENAIFGGENSGHSYFRDFFFADNGIIPLILFLNIISNRSEPVSEILAAIRNDYPVSGEINFAVGDVQATTTRVASKYEKEGTVDWLDGLSVSFRDWRFNLRPSNTEPLLRLNVEGRSAEVVEQKTAELKELLEG